MNVKKILSLFILYIFFSPILPAQEYPSLNNHKIDGYKGIWFTLGQFYKYGDKYSGGLSTYTAKHIPLAIYSPEADKTFFVYGGMTEDRKSNADQPDRKNKDYGNYLLCMIGEFDHKTQTLSKPVVVHDKKGVYDPHDNPSIVIDDKGYIWVFVSGRGRGRMGYKYKSSQAYNINKFEVIRSDEITYPQPKYISNKGFLHLFTKYHGTRLLYFNVSKDGVEWTEDQQLAAIKRPGDKNGGHYQISGQQGNKVGFFFNWHPNGDVDRRTNIYYMETSDFGKTWTTVDGEKVDIPVTELESSTLVKEFFSKKENVYIKDMTFDSDGYPVALYLSGKGHDPGPENGLKMWSVVHWDGSQWNDYNITTSDHNYDTGSIWVEGSNWTVVAPTKNLPQPWGGGGEIIIWKSRDNGKTWKEEKQITHNSKYNHNYIRKVVNGKEPFIFFWADGNPDEQSKSELYFGNNQGQVWRMPYEMKKDKEKAIEIR